MFYLNSNSSKIDRIRNKYWEAIKEFLNSKFPDKIDNNVDFNEGLKNEIKKFLRDYFFDEENKEAIKRLKEIITAKPDHLCKLHKKFEIKAKNSFHTPEKKAALKKAITSVFNYKDFTDKRTKPINAYDLANWLEVKTCTYCNRNYTSTIITKNREKIIRPEFDHFFPKSEYPLLALSFYNLIPSCPVCNSRIKGRKEMNLKFYPHPYRDDISKEFYFTYYLTNENPFHYKAKVITENYKARNYADLFKLEEVYTSHADVIKDLIYLRRAYSIRYLQILKNEILPGIHLTDNELYRLAFGTEYEESKHLDRPLSKFKKDLLRELGILYFMEKDE